MSRFFLLLTLSIAVILLLPPLVQDGMFIDGVTYAAMARNMAEGEGSFWHIHYTPTLFSDYHVHPPLVVGMASILYRILGDSLVVERVFTLLTFLFSAFFIFKIWNEIKENQADKYSFGLPILLWLIIPCVHWAYRSNMLENGMCIFTTCAAWLCIKGEKEEKLSYFLWAGTSLTLAILSKGLVAVFIWAIPFAYFIFIKKKRDWRWLIPTILLVTTPIFLLFTCIFISPEAKQGLYLYFHDFVNNVNQQTVSSRFALLGMLAQSLALPLILSLGIHFLGRQTTHFNGFPLFFIFIGLCGSLPMMISLKQADYYMLAAMPFFALGLASWIEKNFQFLLKRVSNISLWNKIGVGILVLSLIISLSFFGKIGRDKEIIEDMKVLKPFLSPETIVNIPAEMETDWEMYAYFERYLKVGLDTRRESRPYLLVKSEFLPIVPPNYEEVKEAKTQKWHLFRKLQTQ